MKKYELHLDRDRIAEAKAIRSAWYKGEPVDRTPFVFGVRAPKTNAWLTNNPYNFEEVLADTNKMIESQIGAINWQTDNFPDCDYVPMFQTFGYGEGIIASFLGAEQLITKHDPPFTKGRFLKTIEEVATKLPKTIDPDNMPWGKLVREQCDAFLDATNGEVPIGVWDHQSPYGTATKLIGNEDLMFAMYDEPELVHLLLSTVTDCIIQGVHTLQRWFGKEHVVLNGNLGLPGEGGIIIWDDYVSVITPALHQEFCRPYNQHLYDTFGRGHLHTCGPYFDGYIDACVACKPVSFDVSAMRGLAKTREDLLAFRKITRENGIRLTGSITAYKTSQYAQEDVKDIDEAFLRVMADGGLLLHDGGDLERGNYIAALTKRIPQN